MTPEEARTQQLEALRRGNATRTAKARLKQQIHAGEVSASEVVRTTTLPLTTLDVARALRGFGEEKTRRLVRKTGVDPSRPIAVPNRRKRPLPASQREAVADYFAKYEQRRKA